MYARYELGYLSITLMTQNNIALEGGTFIIYIVVLFILLFRCEPLRKFFFIHVYELQFLNTVSKAVN